MPNDEKQEQPPTPAHLHVPHGTWAITVKDKDEVLYVLEVTGPTMLEIACA